MKSKPNIFIVKLIGFKHTYVYCKVFWIQKQIFWLQSLLNSKTHILIVKFGKYDDDDDNDEEEDDDDGDDDDDELVVI